MQRKIINLQHFAEETNPQGGDPANTEPNSKGNDGKTGELKYTDEDVNRLLNKKFAEWQKKKEAEISEAQKLAEMNEQEKAEHQRDQLQKELDELKQKDALAEMSKTARKMLPMFRLYSADLRRLAKPICILRAELSPKTAARCL